MKTGQMILMLHADGSQSVHHLTPEEGAVIAEDYPAVIVTVITVSITQDIDI